MSNWTGCIFVGIVQVNTFQTSLEAVNKELSITSILSNTKKMKNLLRVITKHEVCGLFEERGKLRIPVSVVCNKCS